MKALWILVCALGVLGMTAVVVSIMGSGPCTAPPCTQAGAKCQQQCNGPETYCCNAALECVSCAPCSNEACPPAPPCSTAVCIDPSECGDSSAESVICCRYDFWDPTSPCPVEGDDPDNPSNWRGTCNEQHQCVGP